jgi:hypothetical protein
MSVQIRLESRHGSVLRNAAGPRLHRPVRHLLAGALAAVTTAALVVTPASAHDRCDSLANAATAAGVFWPPSAGFQVGYYLAKFIDESTKEGTIDPNVVDCGGAILLSPEDYARITGNTDPEGYFYPYWKTTGAFIEASRDFNVAKARWQRLREAVRDAKVDGNADLAAELQSQADAAHASMTARFIGYQSAHDVYAAAVAEAAAVYRDRELSFVPPLSVDRVVKIMQSTLDGDVPEFEVRFWVDIACTPPALIDPEGILAPADRFVNDDVPPGTFLNDEILQSPATILERIAVTLSTDVKASLVRLLPEGYDDNAELPVPCVGDLTGDGVINSADLAIILGAWGVCP